LKAILGQTQTLIDVLYHFELPFSFIRSINELASQIQ